MVTEVYVEPVAGADQRRVEGAALAAECVVEGAGVGAVIFVIDPHVFAASAALVGIAGIGGVTEMHHAEGFGASIVESIEVSEEATREFLREVGLDPRVVGPIPVHRQRRSIRQLKLQTALAQRIEGRIRLVEVELNAVGLGHTLQDRRGRFSGWIEPAGDALGVAMQSLWEVLVGLVDGETEAALLAAPVAPEIPIIGVDKMLIGLIEHRFGVQGL